MNTEVMFSANSDDWATPWDFFQQQEEKYGPFDLDVCALPDTAKCARFFTPESDGLAQTWEGICWCNPPYSNAQAWVEKGIAEVAKGRATRVVFLLPARTSNHWWHDLIFPLAKKIDFVRGRIKFEGAKSGAPFPSAVVVFE